MQKAGLERKNTIPRPGIVFLRSDPNRSIGQRPRKPLTVSVSKKVFKTAVLRNSVKRKVREAYRLAVKELSASLQASGKPSKHGTLHQLPFLRIDAREGVLQMKLEEIKSLIMAQLQI